jgi:hypothetical protein
MPKRGDIYDLLDQIAERPNMFVEGHSLEQLSMMLHGYEACLWSHDLEEDVEGRPFHTASFNEWLREKKGWATDCGFAHAIGHEEADAKAALALFFELLAAYRAS